MDERPVRARVAVSVSLLSALFFTANLTLAETARPQLLGRQFSRDYIVKFLGLNAFTVYDGITTYQTNQVRAEASENDMDTVADYVNNHYAAPNPDTFGIAKGKNVIYIHLESFQQFLIDYKLKDETGVEHEVTPFINSIYHNNSTYSFDNFFHQVGQGKTSDAETMFENSLFGLDQGSLFTQVGGKNTFEAAPAILNQEAGYTSAVFHGNTVSNHYPYSQFTNDEAGFPIANTSDETINGYFATANYLDKSVEEFFNYLKASGLYENSVIVLYGDHYGISNSRNKNLAELVGKDKSTWTDYDNSAMQRVPYMVHIPGQSNGGINHTYGGQIDALPTLLHLLGIDTKNYIQMGQDLFSKSNEQVVAFRNGNVVSPKYTVLGSSIYETATGRLIVEPTEQENQEIQALKDKANLQLQMSDQTTNGDLLRFYTNSGLSPVDPDDYNYKDQLEQLQKIEKDKGKDSTSVYSKNNNTSTVDKYHTESFQDYLKSGK
ncbi:hypothetical protein HW555_014202 [Spodoptera exigua]|uniref:Sulfatase N-terminal domain-containing protein n=1 Tax=Spodoptera exigua TaxID=7107 RepID=A0A835G1U0_SPOEX|nr:hypothetical protein HW555_014202 [Spodoptera exigua]